jgi:hypothetical protein
MKENRDVFSYEKNRCLFLERCPKENNGRGMDVL